MGPRGERPESVMRRIGMGAAAGAMSLACGWSAFAQTTQPASSAPSSLPAPGSDPMRIDPAADPILRLARSQASREAFRSVVAAAVNKHPGTREYQALTEEARQVVAEAHE